MGTLDLLPSSPEATRVLQVVGRALCFATSFETDCRMLALRLRLRDPFLDTAQPDQFEKFVQEPAIAHLARSLDIIVQGLSFEKTYDGLLTCAREARNFIAHEAAENLEQVLATDSARTQWQQLVDTKVRDVAMGKLVLALLLPQVSALERPDRPTIQSYPEHAISWVSQRV